LTLLDDFKLACIYISYFSPYLYKAGVNETKDDEKSPIVMQETDKIIDNGKEISEFGRSWKRQLLG